MIGRISCLKSPFSGNFRQFLISWLKNQAKSYMIEPDRLFYEQTEQESAGPHRQKQAGKTVLFQAFRTLAEIQRKEVFI